VEQFSEGVQRVEVAAGSPLVANVFEGDTSLLAWSPLGSGAVVEAS